MGISAIAAVALRTLGINSDRVRVIGIHFCVLLLLDSTLGDSLESLFHIDSLLRGRLKVRDVAFGLTPRHGPLLCYLTLILLNINLVTQDDEREVIRIMRACLDQEFVSPTIKHLERLCVIDVIHQNTAICAAVESDPKGLETFLTSCIPELHCDESIIHHHLFS